MSGELQGLLPVAGLGDLADLRQRLHKDLARAEKDIGVLGKRLDNPKFVANAPAAVVEAAQLDLSEAQQQQQLAQQRLQSLT